MRRKHWLILALAVLVVWLLWANQAPVVTEYVLTAKNIPEAFSGFRIAQISDLHNREFGGNHEKLLSLLEGTRPDLIVMTGDLVDSRRTDIQTALDFVEGAGEIAPCFYVTGNHESRIKEYNLLEAGLRKLGVTVLRNESVLLERDGNPLLLVGAEDPAFSVDYLTGDSAQAMEQALAPYGDSQLYTILLSHRPELFEVYVRVGVDLVFSGHAHGGQIRLPLLGGLVAPNQGFFPLYDAGLYKEGDTSMLVSRGIGNSIFPLRINNRPEILVAELWHISE